MIYGMKIPKIDTIEKLVSKWGNCVTCPIGQFATRKAFVSGSREPKFLFIGEGPGVSEDVLGEPFVGPAGRLLKVALKEAGFVPREVAVTNLVACRPCDKKEGPNRAPLQYEVENCKERLQETIDILMPKILVAVGRVPAQYIGAYGMPFKTIYHPSYILRNGGRRAKQYPDYLKSLKKLRRVTDGKV